MRLLTLLSLTLLCTCVSAQINLRGVVMDLEDSTPLPGAYVYPKSDPGRVKTTTSDGQFTIEIKEADTLIVRYLGYRPLQQFVSVSDTSLELKLLPSTTGSIDAVTVRGQKIRHGELASTRVGQLEIYLNPAAKADPLLAVNSLPAATNADETANVSLRGSPSEATGVYLNDVPIRSAVRLDQSNGVGQFSIFGQVPLSEVRIYASSPPVSFSQTSAGAVGLYTSRQLPAAISTGLSLNLAGIGMSHNRPIGKKGGIRAFANYSNLGAFQVLNAEGLSDLQASRGLDATVQYVHNFNDQASLQVFYLGFNESYRFQVRTPYYTGAIEQKKPRHLSILNWRIKGQDWAWSFNQSIDWERASFGLGNILTVPRRLTGHLAAHGRYEGAGFSLQTGGTFNLYADRVTGTSPLTSHYFRPEDPSISYERKTDHQLGEAYAYAQFRLGEKWLAGLGLKPVYQPNAGIFRATTQASLRYKPGSYHRFNFGGGSFAQFLSPGPQLREWQWLKMKQVSLEYTYERRHWKVEAATYLKRESYEKSADLNVRGAETRLTYKDDDWVAWTSLALVRSRSTTGEVPTNRDLPFLARTQVQRKFGGNVTLGIAANWRRGAYFRPVIDRTPLDGTDNWFAPILAETDDGQRYPNYQRIDLSASKMLPLGDGTLILYLNVNNLLDTENIRAYSYDASYLERSKELYSQRILFVGGVLNW